MLPEAADVPRAIGARSDWSGYATYTLGFLSLISACNFLDRSILGLALPVIKTEMQVSDTVLGLVSGLAFVLFYSILGVPIAWLADRWSRRNIVAIGLAFWSLMTSLTGLVTNIWQLAAARFLMGAGEACGLAPSTSMVSDLFRKASRPLALAIFGTANSFAHLAFFPVVGSIGETYGWRHMFTAAGVAGLLLAPLFLFTVREPTRGASEENPQRADPHSFAETVRFLAGSRAFLLIALGAMFMGANVYAASTWSAAFLMRVHGLDMAEIASSIGPLRGLLGGLGILLGGVLTDRLGRRDERWRLGVPAVACLLVGPAEALFLLGDTATVWMTGFALTSLFTLLHQAPIFAVAMSVAKVRMRAMAISILVLFASFLGQVIGPFLVGFLNDQLAARLGDLAVRYSLLVIAFCAVGAGLCFWAAIRYFESDSRRATT